jgi:YjbE family integral membrane protein
VLLINLVLSGDNAVVIGMAARRLPERQKKRAIWLGSAAAIVMRLMLTAAAVYVLRIPYLQAAGAVFLFYIAIRLLISEDDVHPVREAASLRSAIWTIMAADFVMSLDNVLAVAAAAQGNMLVLAAGIAMSIPLIVWGSSLVVGALNRYPVLIYIGAGLLGFTAGEMLLSDVALARRFAAAHESIAWVLPLGGAAAVVVGGWIGSKIREN